MNINNVYLKSLQLGLLFLASNGVLFGEIVVYSSQPISANVAENCIKYCRKDKDESVEDVIRGNTVVFDKYGVPYKTLREVRDWDIEKEERDKRMDISRKHSDILKQIKLHNAVVCVLSKDASEESPALGMLRLGTTDVSVYEKIKQYYENNELLFLL